MTDARPARPRRSAAQTREHILETAHDLFYWQGIRATGVHQIAAGAGVAPTTLYRVFASKDDLVAAYVERADRLYQEWFTSTIAEAGPDPRAKILSLFDAQSDQVDPTRCRGCPFAMALAELPDKGLPAHRHAVESRARVRDAFRRLTADLAGVTRIDDSDELADRLMLIFEGVYATVTSLGSTGPAVRARALVQTLLPAPSEPEPRPRP
jgi:AcrR family transcriptional regulator